MIDPIYNDTQHGGAAAWMIIAIVAAVTVGFICTAQSWTAPRANSVEVQR